MRKRPTTIFWQLTAQRTGDAPARFAAAQRATTRAVDYTLLQENRPSIIASH